MAVIYAADLDRTLIFSKKFINYSNKEKSVLVEEIEKEGSKVPISYMNIKALNILESLKQEENFLFVPTTTRSLEQFLRISSRLTKSSYAIVANGGKIITNNEKVSVFEPWEKIISEKLLKDKKIFSEIIDVLQSLCPYLKKEFKSVDDVFFYAVILEKYKNIILESVAEIVKRYDWEYTLQGFKLYVMPKYINKESAVAFLKEYTNSDILITSGDGKLDTAFIQLGDKSYTPLDSEVLFYLPKGYKTNLVPDGLRGTEIMMKSVLKIVKQNNRGKID